MEGRAAHLFPASLRQKPGTVCGLQLNHPNTFTICRGLSFKAFLNYLLGKPPPAKGSSLSPNSPAAALACSRFLNSCRVFKPSHLKHSFTRAVWETLWTLHPSMARHNDTTYMPGFPMSLKHLSSTTYCQTCLTEQLGQRLGDVPHISLQHCAATRQDCKRLEVVPLETSLWRKRDGYILHGTSRSKQSCCVDHRGC